MRMSGMTIRIAVLVAAGSLIAGPGCETKPAPKPTGGGGTVANSDRAVPTDAAKSPEKHADDHDHGHGHTHTAPHGGTLIALGDHFAHLEFVLAADTGKLTIYVLDGEAEKPIRVAHPELNLSIRKPGDAAELELTLPAIANALTGEKSGDTSEFSVTDERLKGVKEFQGTLKKLTVKGKDHVDLAIPFPKGNE